MRQLKHFPKIIEKIIRVEPIITICGWLTARYYRFKYGHLVFLFNGKRYSYFYHHFTVTFFGERTIEIPIVYDIVRAYRGQLILEIGNVLSNYFKVSHDIVDKYDRGSKVIQEDVVSYSAKMYDLIVSISTLEHVGFDEKKKDPKKVLKAIKNLKGLLNRKGMLIATMPLGYNPHLDILIKKEALGFTKQYYLKRISATNEWTQVKKVDVLGAKYNSPYPYANALVVGVFKK